MRFAVLVIPAPLAVGGLVVAAVLFMPLALQGKGRERSKSGVFLTRLIPERAP